MFAVDSDASLHMMRVYSRTTHRKEYHQTNAELPRNPHSECHGSNCGGSQSLHHVSPSVVSLGRLCNESGCSYSRNAEEIPKLTKRRKTRISETKKFGGKAIGSVSSKEVQEPLVKMQEPFTDGVFDDDAILVHKPPSADFASGKTLQL